LNYRWRSFSLLGATLLLLTASAQAPALPPIEEVSNWVIANAHPLAAIDPGSPLDDLVPLDRIIADTGLVLLGESRHDAREHFLLKHRLIEYLISRKGFTVLAMEESLPCASRINSWLLGGPGDPEELVDAMSAWFIWSTEEVLALIKWLRAWNDDPAHLDKVRFFGIDTMDPLPAVEDLTLYLKRVDPQAVTLLHEIPLNQFSRGSWPETIGSYQALTREQLLTIDNRITALHTRMAGLEKEYTARSSGSEYRWHLRLTLNMKQSHDFFRTSTRAGFLETGNVREQAMTANALWLYREYLQGEKMMIWAHNLHVGRDSFDLDIPNRPATRGMVPMGYRLDKELGDEMITIGFSFARGSLRQEPLPMAPPHTVDGVLATTDLPRYFIDLRHPPQGPVHDWLHARQAMRAEGGMATLVPARAFDLIVFTGELTRTVPTAGAARRLRQSR
jgi:erythromycin esterase